MKQKALLFSLLAVFCFIIFFGCGDNNGNVDGEEIKWVRSIGGEDDDFGRSLIQTADGGYVVAGYTESFGAGDYDLFLVKLSATGWVEWARSIGGAGAEGRSIWTHATIVQTDDGGFAVAGETESFGAGGYDLFLVKLTATGWVEWARTIGGPRGDWGGIVVQTDDGGFAVAGETESFGSGYDDDDFFLVKLSATGWIEWARTIGGTHYEWAPTVVQTDDGGFAVAGGTGSFGTDGLLFVKLSLSGALEWAKFIEGACGGDDDITISFVQTSDGGYVLASLIEEGFGNDCDYIILKLSETGTLEWAKAIAQDEDDVVLSIIQASDGGYVIAGGYYSYGTVEDNLFLGKFSSTGNIKWAYTLGGTSTELCGGVIQTYDGGYAVSGLTESYTERGDGSNVIVAKFDANGHCCIGEELFPIVSDVTSLTAVSVTPTIKDITPTIMDVSPTVTDVSPTVMNICSD